ncbi:hypothetical protein IEE91_11810 [Kocuria sp. cx-455]|uniref:hypothetical protein n=1 Tax=Kocuria sp. cx-455 TaxID=2771377 RepID=UPI0016862393|nr:hypothetical protein [Kocuria sp. cx-455]MBD2765862.1 hypothetical protein [Kocuria sp. cx-455]
MNSLSASPQYLIGPHLYPAFIRLTRWMLPMVLVVAAAVNAAVYLGTEPTPVIGAMIVTVLTRAVVAAILTVAILVALFAVLERVLPPEQVAQLVPAGPFSGRVVPSQDMRARSSPGHLTETVGSLVFLGFLGLIPIIPTSFVYAGHLNGGGSFLNQELWNLWLPVYYGFLVVFAGVEVWRAHAPRLTAIKRLAGLGITLAFAAFLSAAILTQDIMDPAILDDAAWSRASWLDPALVALLWMLALLSVRRRRIAPAPV